jgi:hypothetical protein
LATVRPTLVAPAPNVSTTAKPALATVVLELNVSAESDAASWPVWLVAKALAMMQSSHARPTAIAALSENCDLGSTIVFSSSKLSISCAISPSCGKTQRRVKSVSVRWIGEKRPAGALSWTAPIWLTGEAILPTWTLRGPCRAASTPSAEA